MTLFSTENQIFIFIAYFIYGIISFYLILNASKLCNKIKIKKIQIQKITQFFIDFLVCVLIAVGYIYLNTKFNFGEFRLFILIGYLLGFLVAFNFKKLAKIKISKKSSKKK